jgi:hypothetical protein
MFVATTSETALPFYGYAAGGTADCWTYFDGATDDWHVNNGGNRLTVGSDGYVGVGRSIPISNFSKFDVQTPAGDNTAGGMYVATASETGVPFYAYAAGGTEDARTYYLGQTGKWILQNGSGLLVVENTGDVGLGTAAPGFTLEVNGTAGKPGGGSWSNSSDLRLKKNVAKLDDALESLLQLRGVTFEYKDPKSINERSGERIGLIAQEVEKVFPDWVEQRDDGYKIVTFRGFEALTVEALRELRDEKDLQIADLRLENDNEIAKRDQEIAALRTAHEKLQQQVNQLEQLVTQLTAINDQNHK